MTEGMATKPEGRGEGGERYLIRKGGYFYRPNAQGYTGCKAEAGRYTLEEAISLTHPNGPDGPRDDLSYMLDDTLTPSKPEGIDDADLLDWLEEQARNSRTGISFDWVPACEGEPSGFRFMRRHFIGEQAKTLRDAIRLAQRAVRS